MKWSSFKYLVKQGWHSMVANRLMTLASIGVLVACLMITGVAALLSVNVTSYVDYLETLNEIVFFIDDAAPAETVEAIKKISTEIGKTPVQVNEAAGFVVNRILIPMINEAAFIKMEGVSDIAGIDTAMKLGANHPMGPLELGDFIGLDICLAIMDVLYKETGDSKYRACPLIRKMVRGGNLGCKTGKGFYVYNADRTKTPVDAL